MFFFVVYGFYVKIVVGKKIRILYMLKGVEI